jgi:hypothetical protein
MDGKRWGLEIENVAVEKGIALKFQTYNKI